MYDHDTSLFWELDNPDTTTEEEFENLLAECEFDDEENEKVFIGTDEEWELYDKSTD